MFRAGPWYDRGAMHRPLEALADDLQHSLGDLAGAGEALRLLDEILDSAVIPLVVGDGLHWRMVSRSFADALGRTVDEIKQAQWPELMHPADVPATMAAGFACLQTGLPQTICNRYRHADGTYLAFRWQWGPPGSLGYTIASGELLK